MATTITRATRIDIVHWGLSSGYRFMAIEGLVDNNNDGVPETTFEGHSDSYARSAGQFAPCAGVVQPVLRRDCDPV